MPDTALRGINIPPVLDSVGGPEHQNSANTYLAPIDLAVNKKKTTQLLFKNAFKLWFSHLRFGKLNMNHLNLVSLDLV